MDILAHILHNCLVMNNNYAIKADVSHLYNNNCSEETHTVTLRLVSSACNITISTSKWFEVTLGPARLVGTPHKSPWITWQFARLHERTIPLDWHVQVWQTTGQLHASLNRRPKKAKARIMNKTWLQYYSPYGCKR